MRPLIAALTALALAASPLAAAAAPYRAPRTAAGAPDLNGVWTYNWLTDLERDPDDFKTLIVPEAAALAYEKRANDPVAQAADFAAKHPGEPNFDEDDGFYAWGDYRLARIDGQARSSIIVDPADGKVPWSEAGKARRKALRERMSGWDGPDQKSPQNRCLFGMGAPMGPPLAPAGDETNLQIVQTPDVVLLVGEANHETRFVRLHSAHLPPQLRPWMGDSIGWWEGDVLVVETVGFNPGETLRRGFSLGPKARVTERFRRVSAGEVRYSYTVEDPDNYTRPWKGELPLAWFGKPLLEDVCHEGDYDTATTFAGKRKEEADQRVAVAAFAAALRARTPPAPARPPAPRRAPGTAAAAPR
jgi:hypothetical protein